MSFKLRAIVTCAALGLTAVAGCNKMVETFPPALRLAQPGSFINKRNGQRAYVVGYTGHHADTFKAIARRERDLFFTSFQIAQGYALRNGKASAGQPAAPVVGRIVADGPIDDRDGSVLGTRTADEILDGSRLFEPLTPEGQRKLNVRIDKLIAITPETRMGVVGSAQRMCAYIAARFKTKSGNSPTSALPRRE